VRKSVFIMHRSILPRRLSLTEWRFRRLTAKRLSQLRLLPSVRSRVRLSSSRLSHSRNRAIFLARSHDPHSRIIPRLAVGANNSLPFARFFRLLTWIDRDAIVAEKLTHREFARFFRLLR
jgi:hypothetical protein